MTDSVVYLVDENNFHNRFQNFQANEIIDKNNHPGMYINMFDYEKMLCEKCFNKLSTDEMKKLNNKLYKLKDLTTWFEKHKDDIKISIYCCGAPVVFFLSLYLTILASCGRITEDNSYELNEVF